jgi:hypothetical protein
VLWVVSVDRLHCYVYLYAPFGSRPFVVQSLTVGVASAPDLCPHLALQGVFWVFVVGKGGSVSGDLDWENGNAC